MSSTPTLFNSGTRRSQLASCYLTTVSDDLDGIYEAIKENAMLAKYAGGIGNDWTPVRALGAYIKGTNGKSQGVVPFLKVVNDTAVAVNQGGKRKGAVCSYLETWHLDIEEFLELRKNTGDDRRRTHDMNTANWVPDLFMKRVMENGEWTLFSPSDVPDLHEKFGTRLREGLRRVRGEGRARRAEALQEDSRGAAVAEDALDAVRDRASVDHVQGSVQPAAPAAARRRRAQLESLHRDHAQHRVRTRSRCATWARSTCRRTSTVDGAHGHGEAEAHVGTAMRMLDNVIDLNFYSVDKARNSNFKHRPVGLGIMGFQDCLHMLRIPYASAAAVEFADRSMEAIAYTAYWASTDLAEERGPYRRSRARCGTAASCRSTRSSSSRRSAAATSSATCPRRSTGRRCAKRIKQVGMRNSNCLAIAPTATIANITGLSQCIEPTYQNLYVKSNLSGEFTVVNEFLVRDLKRLNLWDEVMIADLKYFDGSLAQIDRIPPRCAASTPRRSRSSRRGWSRRGAAAEMDRPVAVAQHLHGGRVGQEARRDLQARVAARAEDDLLPAHAGRDVGREIDGHGGPAERGAERRRRRRQPRRTAEPKFCAIDDPECESCQ